MDRTAHLDVSGLTVRLCIERFWMRLAMYRASLR